MRSVSRFSFVLTLLTFSLIYSFQLSASSLPDYYSEPGENSYREYNGQTANEFIDPLGGMLQRTYVDAVIPGPANFDLVVQRFYRSPQGFVTAANRLSYFGESSVLGQGWDMHFGRIWYGRSFSSDGLTSCGTNKARTGQNPVLELADGTRKELLNDTSSSTDRYITKDLWIGVCEGGGLTVTSPAGMKYFFTYFKTTLDNTDAWHATKIQDSHGNSFAVTYDLSRSQPVIDSVIASDGRKIEFEYFNDGFGTILNELKVGSTSSTTWKVRYSHDYRSLPGRYFLTNVERRSEYGRWEYDYYPGQTSSAGSVGHYAMEYALAPTGLRTTYTYKRVRFQPSRVSTALGTKVITGAQVQGGTWTYNYFPSTGSSNPLDKTEVISPLYCTEYFHEGAAYSLNENVWRIGLLMRTKLHNAKSCSSSVLEDTTYTWGSLHVSNQGEAHRRTTAFDSNSVMPLLTSKKITRDFYSTYETIYSDFDAFGNPQKIEEKGPQGASDNRVTTMRYRNFDTSSTRILGLVESRQVEGEVFKAVANDYYSTGVLIGRLKSESVYGRTARTFEYYTSGNNLRGELKKLIDERGISIEYSDYYRGTPRYEDHPEGIIIKRDVDWLGRISTATDGEGNVTGYTYDYFNRVSGITTAKTEGQESNISIGWGTGARIRTVTRGQYVEVQRSDGYGNLKETKVNDTVFKQFSYNSEGHLTSETAPFHLGEAKRATTYSPDALGRAKSITHADGTSIFYDYSLAGQPNTMSVKDERNHYTFREYLSWGDPNERYLTRITAPENATTVITRDDTGIIKSVTQNGFTRTYVTDIKKLADKEIHPEVGEIDLKYNDAGLLDSREILNSDLKIRYRWDFKGRLANIFYPVVGELTTEYLYYDNDLLKSVANGVARWNYKYDKNLNLKEEKASINFPLKDYVIRYNYDDRDNLESIEYPNGLLVEYSPDELGRPTKVGGFVSRIDYHANGQPKRVTYTNGVVERVEQDSRLRTKEISASKPGSSDLVRHEYDYDNAGNTKYIKDHVSSDVLTLGYDGLNRLNVANGPWGTGVINYDSSGNIENKRIGSHQLTYKYDSDTNRLENIRGSESYDFQYDDFGAVRSNGRDTFFFNTAEQLSSISNKFTLFGYDGNNRRFIKKVRGNIEKITVYSRDGKLIYETDQQETYSIAYIYLGSSLVAKQEFCNLGNTDTDSDGLRDCDEMKLGLDANQADTDGDGINDGDEDSDSDGLTNQYELQIGTSPRDQDTDGDGISDPYEQQYGLNPTVADADEDPDSDGLTNIEESNLGTSPKEADTDGDGLSDGQEIINGTDPLYNFAALLPPIVHPVLNLY